jgi:putrescine aminotransferase
MKAMHPIGDLPIPGVEHVRQPYWYNEGRDMSPRPLARLRQAIEERILAVGPENVAAFIGEPVQGAGGVIIPPANYWPQVEAICRKYGILLICDEVICGFGRTGNMWGHETVGVKPDIIAMAKGLSSATCRFPQSRSVRDRGGDENRRRFRPRLYLFGPPGLRAVALRNIEIMEREGLVERTRSDTGPYLAKALAAGRSSAGRRSTRSSACLARSRSWPTRHQQALWRGKEGNAGPMVRDAASQTA